MTPFLADATHVIIYRSRLEESADTFWWDLMSDHPTGTLVVIGLVVLGVVGFYAASNRRR